MKNIIILSLLFSVITSCSLSVSANEWNYQLEPYIMFTSIDGNATVGRINETDVNVDFGTILDHLDAAAMVHFEAHHDSGWGIMFDYGFMDLSGSKTNANGSSTRAEVRQGVLELEGLYRNRLANGYLDYYSGVRWWDNDVEVGIYSAPLPGEGLNKKAKAGWVDLVFGARWLTNINNNWTFLAQADLGLFGVESDFTSSVQSGFLYKINDLLTLDMKYKATWVNYEEGNDGQPGYFNYDTVTYGPIIGLVFNF